jgi:hypothetical protein
MATDQAAPLSDLMPVAASTLDEQIAVQPVEIRERLAARYFTRSALRRCRLDARNEDLRELARQIIAEGGPIEGKPLAREVVRRVFRPRGFERRVISHGDLEPPDLPQRADCAAETHLPIIDESIWQISRGSAAAALWG